MMRTPNTSHSLKWSWLRHAVQIAALLLFAAPLLVAGWGLFGVSVGGDDLKDPERVQEGDPSYR